MRVKRAKKEKNKLGESQGSVHEPEVLAPALREPEVLGPEEEVAGDESTPEVVDAEVELPIDDFEEALPPIGTQSEALEAEIGDGKGEGGLVRYDPLEAYLREIRAYPHLTKDEEHALAVRYATSEDVQAAYKLVTSNLWLVVKIARDYERAARSVLDLIQEGNIGLMEAVKNFDPYRGVRFPSYAVWWIKAYIVRYLIANWRLVKIGTTQAQRKLFFNLKKEQERLEKEGFSAEPKLLAERLNVKESEVVEMQQRLAAPDMSMDAPLQTDADSNMMSLLPAPTVGAEELLQKKRMDELIKKSIDEFSNNLKEKDRIVFEKRLLSEEKSTLQEVSEIVKLSKERVRQIENQLKDKFKTFLEQEFGQDVQELLP